MTAESANLRNQAESAAFRTGRPNSIVLLQFRLYSAIGRPSSGISQTSGRTRFLSIPSVSDSASLLEAFKPRPPSAPA